MNQVKGDVASKDESTTSGGKIELEGPMRLKRVWQPGDIKKEDWKWPIYDQWRSIETNSVERKLREPEPEPETDEDKSNEAPFEVTYEQDGPMQDMVTVTLSSRSLIDMAKHCLPQNEQNFSIEKPKIDAKDMFNDLQAFKDANQSIQQDVSASESQKWHSKHLLRFLETHFKDTTAQVEKGRQDKKVSFDLLWAFIYKREKVYYKCLLTGNRLKGTVTLAYFKKNRSEKRFKVHLECRVYNGYKYVISTVKFAVNEFKSKRDFHSIGICPLSLLEQSEEAEMEGMFLRNGKKFHDIVTRRSAYMQYEGPRIWYEDVGTRLPLKKQKADGRVMVDLLSFANTNPGYELDTARPPTNRNAQGHVQDSREEDMPTDDELRLAPAVVYGFSFSNKLWGGFDVNGLTHIQFDDQAFDRDLVLTDRNTKDMLKALVSQYVSADHARSPQIDPISNKGDGCIFLCYGPPGTGKTLTAEAIAEKFHCPLWSVSVFELGVTVKDLERNLMEILDIASLWRAVLLLDEADVYLEKRVTNADPNRIAMTAIFLRVLEYYRGVLFLTTNRVASFDDAFCSRISMFLRFQRLNSAQRESIWRNLLFRAEVTTPDLTRLRDYPLNGREIRNCIRIAQTWAKSSGKELTIDLVETVVKMLGDFRKDLAGAIMEETVDQPVSRDFGDDRPISSAFGRALSVKAANIANGITT